MPFLIIIGGLLALFLIIFIKELFQAPRKNYEELPGPKGWQWSGPKRKHWTMAPKKYVATEYRKNKGPFFGDGKVFNDSSQSKMTCM